MYCLHLSQFSGTDGEKLCHVWLDIVKAPMTNFFVQNEMHTRLLDVTYDMSLLTLHISRVRLDRHDCTCHRFYI